LFSPGDHSGGDHGRRPPISDSGSLAGIHQVIIGAFPVEGIVLVVLGIGAMLVPVLATLAVSIFLGWLLLWAALSAP
jgi:hypothetical protein